MLVKVRDAVGQESASLYDLLALPRQAISRHRFVAESRGCLRAPASRFVRSYAMAAGAHAVRAAPPPKSKALFARKRGPQGRGVVDFVLRRQLGACTFLARRQPQDELTVVRCVQQSYLRLSSPSSLLATCSTRPNTISRPTSPLRLHGTSARPSPASSSSHSASPTHNSTTKGESASPPLRRLPLLELPLIFATALSQRRLPHCVVGNRILLPAGSDDALGVCAGRENVRGQVEAGPHSFLRARVVARLLQCVPFAPFGLFAFADDLGAACSWTLGLVRLSLVSLTTTQADGSSLAVHQPNKPLSKPQYAALLEGIPARCVAGVDEVVLCVRRFRVPSLSLTCFPCRRSRPNGLCDASPACDNFA